jgi:hypothetical protein
MSEIQRVIILNKPFRIRGYTMMQWIIMGVAFAIAVLVGTKFVPHDWKLGNVPTGVWVFVVILGLGIGYVHVVQVKPLAWWRNRLFYAVGLEPTLYLPKREEGQEYPDSSIKQAPKREDQSYVEVEHFDETPR